MLIDSLKRGLKSWTTSMMGDNVEEKIAALSRSENEYGVDPTQPRVQEHVEEIGRPSRARAEEH